jgi:hypothetical protein
MNKMGRTYRKHRGDEKYVQDFIWKTCGEETA